MKRTLLILAIAMVMISAVTSCTTSRGMSKNGCYGTQGFVGYGSR